MRAHKYLLLTVLTVILTTSTCWGDSVITGFQGNGEVTVTGLWTNARYHVEWASSLDGPWYRSWQPCYDEESQSNTTVTIKVPMFYRVVMSSNPPPAGMVLVDAGSFQMGDNYSEGAPDERPVHEVYVSAFYMDRYEVSNEQMREVLQWAYDTNKIGATASTVTNSEGNAQELLDLDATDCQISFSGGTFTVDSGKGNVPCVEVSWYGALAYCNYKSDMDKLGRCIDFSDWSCDFSETGYRLPTEAEWEKAARGGLRGHHFPWDSLGGADSAHIDGSKANYWSSGDPYDNATTPVGYYNGSQTPVGTDTANGYGLYDMAGNVFEFCWDWYQTDWYSQPGATQEDTRGPTGPLSYHVLRGGSWSSIAGFLPCAGRGYPFPGLTSSHFGFRCARGL